MDKITDCLPKNSQSLNQLTFWMSNCNERSLFWTKYERNEEKYGRKIIKIKSKDHII